MQMERLTSFAVEKADPFFFMCVLFEMSINSNKYFLHHLHPTFSHSTSSPFQ